MLDTNIISDLMRAPQGKSNQRLQHLMTVVPDLQVCTSIIVDCEVRFGLRRRPSKLLEQAYEDVLQVVEILALDTQVAHQYAKLRSDLEKTGTPIGPNDTLIAAHAMAMNCTLVTADTEFDRVSGLKIENWLVTA